MISSLSKEFLIKVTTPGVAIDDIISSYTASEKLRLALDIDMLRDAFLINIINSAKKSNLLMALALDYSKFSTKI